MGVIAIYLPRLKLVMLVMILIVPCDRRVHARHEESRTLLGSETRTTRSKEAGQNAH